MQNKNFTFYKFFVEKIENSDIWVEKLMIKIKSILFKIYMYLNSIFSKQNKKLTCQNEKKSIKNKRPHGIAKIAWYLRIKWILSFYTHNLIKLKNS